MRPLSARQAQEIFTLGTMLTKIKGQLPLSTTVFFYILCEDSRRVCWNDYIPLTTDWAQFIFSFAYMCTRPVAWTSCVLR